MHKPKYYFTSIKLNKDTSHNETLTHYYTASEPRTQQL